jgi:hypothetical protein
VVGHGVRHQEILSAIICGSSSYKCGFPDSLTREEGSVDQDCKHPRQTIPHGFTRTAPEKPIMTKNPFLFGTLAPQFEIELLSRYVFANFCSERYDEKFLFVGASAPQFQSIIKQVRFKPCVVHRLYSPKRLIMTKKKTFLSELWLLR